MSKVPPGEAIPRNNLISPEGYRKLHEEYQQLQQVERPKVVEEVAAAARLGDRSENAEYKYGKQRLREIDKRLAFLQGRMDRSEIVDNRGKNTTHVLFGATVTVEDEDSRRKQWQLVGEDEADVSLRRISWKSPIGRGLLNKKVGDEVEIETPGGLKSLRICAVSYV